MRYKKIPYEEFVSIYRKVPRAAVDVIVTTPQGILLTKRAMPPYQGKWHIPGGTILFREPIQHAIQRIAKEELGIRVHVVRHLGIIEYLNNEGGHVVSNAYLATIASGTLRDSEQSKGIEFFKRIPTQCIPYQKKFLKDHWDTLTQA